MKLTTLQTTPPTASDLVRCGDLSNHCIGGVNLINMQTITATVKTDPKTICPYCHIPMRLIDDIGIEEEFSQISGPVYKTTWELYECRNCGELKEIDY